MSLQNPMDPTSPTNEEEPGRASAHEPGGVVEAIREEIEEVVEHVPRPVRWTVGKLARLALLVLAGLLVLAILSAVLFVMNRTELVARELSILLNRTLREHRSEEHTSELQSRSDLVCRLLLEKKKQQIARLIS